MEEIWKDIKGYENIYQISSYGRVKSLKRISDCGRHLPEKILKAGNSHGYKSVTLRKNGASKIHSVHRLVGQTFIENPCNFPCINHKDEDKTNNKVNNLEWCTQKYNANYGTRNKRFGDKHGKKVIQFDLSGNEIRRWISCAEAGRYYGRSRITIADACRKHSKSCGYLWRYESEVAT